MKRIFKTVSILVALTLPSALHAEEESVSSYASPADFWPEFSNEFSPEEDPTESESIELKGTLEVFADQASYVLNKVGSRQSSESHSAFMKIYQSHKPVERDIQSLRIAAGASLAVEESGGLNDVEKAAQSETLAAIGEIIADKSEIFRNLKNGLDFSFDFKSLWGKSKSDSHRRRERNSNLKYGLVLQEVIPPENHVAYAAITSIEEEWQYAAKAKPVWGIAPKTRRDERPMYVDIEAARYNIQAQPDRSIRSDDGDFKFSAYNAVARKTVPSAAIKGNIKPRNLRLAGDIAKAGTPPLELTVYQKEHLYSMSYFTKENFEKEKVTHVFRAPIYKEFALKRILDENFESVETVAENILLSSHMPAVSLHHLTQKEIYMARLSYKKDQSSFSILAEAPSSFDPAQDIGKKKGEKLKLNYSLNF